MHPHFLLKKKKKASLFIFRKTVRAALAAWRPVVALKAEASINLAHNYIENKYNLEDETFSKPIFT